jgi:hypothetical protein
LRENDISVSRLHAYIKYDNGSFIVVDNNSKFGTLILLRKSYKIEKKKIALQIGRTVITFSLKVSTVNNVPVFKNPMLMEKLSKWPSSKSSSQIQSNSSLSSLNMNNKAEESSPIIQSDKKSSETKDGVNLNGSFID